MRPQDTVLGGATMTKLIRKESKMPTRRMRESSLEAALITGVSWCTQKIIPTSTVLNIPEREVWKVSAGGGLIVGLSVLNDRGVVNREYSGGVK